MARAGRPPKPIEAHRRTGTYNATKHGSRGPLVAVEAVDAAEVTPFQRAALDVLDEVLSVGVHWLARTDGPSIVILRDLLEERESVRAGALAGSTEDRKALREIDKQVMSLLTDLGFNPAARARLGLAEVKAQSKLDELRERQANRR